MEDRQFDDLSRRIGASTPVDLPRRGLLGLLGGAALTGAFGFSGSTQGLIAERRKKKKRRKKCRKDNQNCVKHKDCCSNTCDKSINKCQPKQSVCPLNPRFDLQWGSFGTGDSQFDTPWGIAADVDGNIYVTDSGNERIQVFGQNGSFTRKFGSDGTGGEQFQEPRGIGANRNGNGQDRVYIADPVQLNANRKFRRFDTSGSFLASIEPAGLGSPHGVTVDIHNNLWVVDNTINGTVFFFNTFGDFNASWTPTGSGDLNNPEGIAVYKENGRTFVFVTDTGNNRVVKFEHVDNSPSGLQFIKAAGSGGEGNDRFNQPIGIAADTCGNIWVADRLNNRIQRLDRDLVFRDRFTSGFNRPTGVALSPNGNALYVVDSDNELIQKFALS